LPRKDDESIYEPFGSSELKKTLAGAEPALPSA
jgi:hypothetical protein